MLQQLRASIVVLLVMTFFLGGVYPLVVTLIAQVAFPYQANGSILESEGRAIGSEWIGQSFRRPEYFWGRLSATSPRPYNAASSSGSNFGPLHAELVKNAMSRLAELKRYDPSLQSIPIDLVTASASGLDPQVSPAAAEIQVRRVAAARQMPENRVRELVRRHTLGRQLGILGEPRVNVLQLNLALDQVARR